MQRGERETERLICRAPAASDEAALRSVFLDARVAQWLTPPPLAPESRAGVAARLDRDRRHWRDHGFGPWVIEDRATSAVVGRGGLAWAVLEGRRRVELPWVVSPDRWGEGLAEEQARAALDVAAEFGVLDGIFSITLPANAPSRRVMEKLGLVLTGEVEHVGLPHVLYELPR